MPFTPSLNIDIPPPSKSLEMRSDGTGAVVYVNGVLRFSAALSDKVSWRHAAVMLYQTGDATQREIAREWQVDIRTVNRWVNSYRREGLGALSDGRGRPVKITDSVKRHIHACRSDGMDVNEIARTLNISTGSVCEVLYGKRRLAEPLLPELDCCADSADRHQSAREPLAEEHDDAELDADCEAEGTAAVESRDADPMDRGPDRAAARAGLLQDAPPVFADCDHVEYAGGFLAVAMLSRDSFLEHVHRVYGSLGAAFYGLQAVFMTLFLMAVLRIKTVERVNRHSVRRLGRILGLDRSPSVRTLRRKIRQLCLRLQSLNLMHLLGRDRLEAARLPDSVLYVDGHVQCYYGKGRLGKTFSTSRNQVVSGMTDYWLNLGDGTPLLCIPTDYNARMTRLFPQILRHARKLCGQRRLTVVFDRGGSSAAAYEKILALDSHFIAYNSNPVPLDDALFRQVPTEINGELHSHAPYERDIELDVYTKNAKGRYRKTRRTVKVREVIVRREDGGQTAVVTSRRDLSEVRVAELIFSRWTQENYLKYAVEEYNLDHLCVYGTEKVSAEIDHPNPEYVELQRTVRSIRRQIATLVGTQLDEMTDPELYRPQERFKELHDGKKGEKLQALGEALKRTREQMKTIPQRVSAGDWERIPAESRLLSNLVKMTAYFVEGQLADILSAHWRGVNGNERGIVAAFLQSTGRLEVSDTNLKITLQPQATPQRTRLLKALCDDLTVMKTTYPGTNLRMIFDVEK